MLCEVGDPARMKAMLVIDQTDIELVRPLLRADGGPKVEIKLDELPHDVLDTQIASIASDSLKVAPRRLASKSGGDLATATNPETGMEEPQGTYYQADTAVIDNSDGRLRVGLRGRAKVHTKWMPLGTRMWRVINHLFSFKL